MPFHVRCEKTDRVVRRLAREMGMGLTDVVRESARFMLESRVKALPLKQRLQALQTEIDGPRLSGHMPVGTSASSLYVPGVTFATILASEPCSDDLCSAIEAASRVYTSSSAAYRGAVLLMERTGIEPGHARHKVDAMITLAGIRSLPPSDRVDDQALVIARDWREAGNNSPPDHFSLMDRAYCATMRVSPVILYPPSHQN